MKNPEEKSPEIKKILQDRLDMYVNALAQNPNHRSLPPPSVRSLPGPAAMSMTSSH
jgi:hypothetical protein